MRHVNYDLWLNLIRKVAQRHLPERNVSIFELGCGTGSLGVKLMLDGFDYVGSDLSFEMAEQAARKDLRVCCADARHLPVCGPFDMAIFLYDGINYMETLEEYTTVFSGIHSILSEGGCFLFDITTEANSLENFYDIFDSENFENLTYVRHSWYDSEKRSQFNDFTFFTRQNGACFNKQYEHHKQQVFSPEEISAAVPSELFSIEGIWNGFTTARYNRRSERIHFLLKRR